MSHPLLISVPQWWKPDVLLHRRFLPWPESHKWAGSTHHLCNSRGLSSPKKPFLTLTFLSVINLFLSPQHFQQGCPLHSLYFLSTCFHPPSSNICILPIPRYVNSPVLLKSLWNIISCSYNTPPISFSVHITHCPHHSCSCNIPFISYHVLQHTAHITHPHHTLFI